MKKIICLCLLLIAPVSFGKRLLHESFYQDEWCEMQGGETEVVLEDRTRIDCLTEAYSIEFDFEDKWAEAIGQSLGYASMTGKKAGIVLILEKKTMIAIYAN